MIPKISPIGVIHSPFTSLENMPIQPAGAFGVEGIVVLESQFINGIKDIEGFSHVYLLYYFHKATRINMVVTPYLDTKERGVFATRSPLRPNHIGLSIVQLIKVEGPKITVTGIDILDGTPLLDIKPYIGKFDNVENSNSGWMKSTGNEIINKRSDNRFA